MVNYEWVLSEWAKFLDISERVVIGRRTVGQINREEQNVYGYKVSDDDLAQAAGLIRKTLTMVIPGWQQHEDWRSLHVQVRHLRADVLAYMTEIRRREEIQANLSPDPGPVIAADSLHPWVWDAARPLWESGNDRAAVHTAATNVNSRLQKKLGRLDIGETALVREAFSTNDPAPDHPRLRLTTKDNPDHFRNVHQGAMKLGSGLFGGVRNPVAHLPESDHDLEEQEALECLAAFSLFRPLGRPGLA